MRGDNENENDDGSQHSNHEDIHTNDNANHLHDSNHVHMFTGSNSNSNNRNKQQEAIHCNGDSNHSKSTSTLPSSEENKTSALRLRIKSFKDVEIEVPSNTILISLLKQHVRNALLGKPPQQEETSGQSPDRYLRLICKGRLLAPDSAELKEFSVQNGDVVHAVVAAAGVKGGMQAALAKTSTLPSGSGAGTATSTGATRARGNSSRLLGLGPGGRMFRVPLVNGTGGGDQDEVDDLDDISLTNEGGDEENGRRQQERVGFDRLRNTYRLSRQEIRVIRSYFSRHVDRYVQANAPSSHDHLEEPDARRRRLLQEDDWMAAQGPTSEFRLNLNANAMMMRFPQATTNNNGLLGNNTNMPMNSATTMVMNDGLWRNTGSRGVRTGSSSHVGTDKDFVWGFLLGFFVGFVMLVWVWMPTVPHKQKLGILTGISFQLAMNVLRQQEQDEYYEDENELGGVVGIGVGGH